MHDATNKPFQPRLTYDRPAPNTDDLLLLKKGGEVVFFGELGKNIHYPFWPFILPIGGFSKDTMQTELSKYCDKFP